MAVKTDTPAICLPFDGWDVESMLTAVTNPFHPPPHGSDDPHQGLDFSILDPVSGAAVGGTLVQAVLPGKAVMVVKGRFPYGNAVLIESNPEQVPPDWWNSIDIPAQAVQPEVTSALSCPPAELPEWDSDRLSIYSLYAHLRDTPAVEVGQKVGCGELLGIVGDSGNALNPHLHLEIRIGPSGWQSSSMAHYDPSGTSEEMSAYCSWRISGRYLVQDPALLLNTMP